MNYQHGIIGGGCAGLQMLYALLNSDITKNDQIIIFEAEAAIPNKSWCFWVKKDSVYQHLVEKSWPEITFRSGNKTIKQSICPYQYQYLSSQVFYNFHLKLIQNQSNVCLIYTNPEQLTATKTGFELKAGGETYLIKNVYDSRPQTNHIAENPILQHFLGRHVVANEPIFEHLAPAIMDFDVAGDGFIYLLPFDAHHALIELTYFSDTVFEAPHYQQILDQFCADRYPQQSLFTTAEEFGQIPMSSKKATGKGDVGQWLIGTAGGITKATTGYTFSRITEDCKKIVKAVGLAQPQNFDRGSNGRFLFYDRLLLGILKRNPKMLQPVMSQLFNKQPFPRILKFLNEESSILEEMQIFSTLPWKPFLKELILQRLKK